MNLRQFVVGLFRGISLNGELDHVREAARQDAQLIVGTYLDEFQAESSRLFRSAQARLIGSEEDVIDVEWETSPNYSEWTKAQLLEELESRGVEAGPKAKKDDLVRLLEESR